MDLTNTCYSQDAEREPARPRRGRAWPGAFSRSVSLAAIGLTLAAAVASANVSIVDRNVTTNTARDGQTITLRYRISSDIETEGWLGATLTSPAGVQVSDPSHESLTADRITIRSGTAWYERQFFINLPPTADHGAYDITWEVHWGQSGFTSSRAEGVLQIREPIPVNVPILMYHKVGPTAHSRYWVSTQRLEEHLRALLERGYTPVTLQDVADYRAGLKSSPSKPVVITFDDGYEDLHTHVWPIVRQSDLRVPITAFVNPGLAGQDNSWDTNIDFNEEPKVRHLTWNQTEALHNSGLFDIQSHTQTHANLLTVSRSERMEELIDSRAELEIRLNKPVRFLAYPWGSGADHSDVNRDVHEAGYFMAAGINNAAETQTRNKWALHRHDIHWKVTATDSSDSANFLFGPNFLNEAGAGGESPHPADTNSDWNLSISEVTAYGAAWRRGDSWPKGPSPIPISYVTHAGALWRGGGSYQYNSGANTWENN